MSRSYQKIIKFGSKFGNLTRNAAKNVKRIVAEEERKKFGKTFLGNYHSMHNFQSVQDWIEELTKKASNGKLARKDKHTESFIFSMFNNKVEDLTEEELLEAAQALFKKSRTK